MNNNNETLTFNSSELENFLNEIIRKNKKIQESNKNPIAVEIQGDAGLGKTTIVKSIAEKNKLNFIKLNLAQLEEIGDLVGLPIKEIELCKNDECVWVNETICQEYISLNYKPTGRSRMGYAPPEWITGKENGGILLLDDWTRADQRYIQAVMELISKQEYISWKLPKGWTIMLTSNPIDGEYMVNEIDNAHRTRFVSVTLKWDEKCWAKWAEFEGIDERCINFVLSNPDIYNEKNKNSICNPRTLEMFFNLISDIEDFSTLESLEKISMYGSATIGEAAGNLFTLFINNRLDKLPSIHDVMTDKDEDKVKKLLKDVIKIDDTYRADVASVLANRIINYSLSYASNNLIKKDYIDRLCSLTVGGDIFTEDISYNIIKQVYIGNKVKFKEIFTRPELNKIIIQ